MASKSNHGDCALKIVTVEGFRFSGTIKYLNFRVSLTVDQKVGLINLNCIDCKELQLVRL